MTGAADRAGLRIALLAHAFADDPDAPASGAAAALSRGLADAGHNPTVITCHRGSGEIELVDGLRVVRVRRLPEGALRFRGFVTPLTHLPFTIAALRAGAFDLAHAFSEVDAWAALGWRHAGGAPVVFTCTEPPARNALADRRQRFRMITAAFQQSDVVTAADAEVGAAIKRWLAMNVTITEPRAARDYERLYLDLLGAPART